MVFFMRNFQPVDLNSVVHVFIRNPLRATIFRGAWDEAAVIALGREQPSHVFEGLKFQRIARGIEKEHRSLFSNLVPEADVGFDAKINPPPGETCGERLPLIPFQYHAVMRQGHVATVNRIEWPSLAIQVHAGLQVNDELMAIEVEVHPGCGGAALRESHHFPVKSPCEFEVVNRDGKVEGRQVRGHGRVIVR